MKIVKGYQCEHCRTLFDKKDDCRECESNHILEDRFEVTTLLHFPTEETPSYNYNNRCGQFPDELIAENKNFSGYAAKYHLVRVGAVEEIYVGKYFDELDE